MGTVIREKNILSWLSGAAIPANTIVVSNARGTVIKGAGANDANIVGVTLYAVTAANQHIDVAGIGDLVWCLAGAAVTHGARIIIGDSSGRGIDCPESAGTTYNVAGFAMGAVSNADELFPLLINIFTHTVET